MDDAEPTAGGPGHLPDEPTLETWFDPETGSATVAVVEAVAAAEGVSLGEVRPRLATVVEADALDALFASRFDGTARDGGCIEFGLSGWRVAVDADAAVVRVYEGG